MSVTLGEIPVAVLAILTAILGVARLTRAIVHDDFPPSIWWRMKWSEWTHDGPWSKLFLCWWCLSFWVALFCIGWFLIGMLVPWIGWAWWIFWGGLSIGYLAAMVIVRDEPDNE
jgi:hypothetical protein